MFRALTCPSSGGQIVLSQHLVSSLSVNGCTVCRMRADCSAVFITHVHNVLVITACRQQIDFQCDLGEIACEGVE